MSITISIHQTNLNKRKARAAKRNVIPGHVVYIVGKARIDSYKVGRTKDFSARMSAYKSYLGEGLHTLMQIQVEDRVSAIKLEKEFIRALSSAEAIRGREWFKMPYPALAALVKDVLSETSVNVKSVRGAPCAIDRMEIAKAEAASISRAILSLKGSTRAPWDF